MIVLLSSGLDSTVNLYEAQRAGEVKLALTFDYGQRAAKKEIQNAAKTCQHLKIPHKVVTLPWLKEITQTSLVNTSESVPVGMDIDDQTQTEETARRVWVPNRNGVFLGIGAAFAEALGASQIIPGFNREEATTFPDNSVAFLKSFTNTLSYSTLSQVEVKCFTGEMNKVEIAKRAKELNVKFEYVWPCYFSEDSICGQCESCLRYERAISELK